MRDSSIGGNCGGMGKINILTGLLLLSVFAVVLGTGPWAVAQTPVNGIETLSQTFHFEGPVLQPKEMDGTVYTSMFMPGALTIAKNAGDPALPVKFVQILVPFGKAVSSVDVKGQLTQFTLDPEEDPTGPVFPYQESLPFGFPRPPALTVNDALYQSSDMFPAEDFDGVAVGGCRGYSIISMALHPVKYVPASGDLFYFTEMTVELELKDSTGPNPMFRTKNKGDEAWVRSLVTNPDVAQGYAQASVKRDDYPGGLCDPSNQYDYVIITARSGGLDYWAPTGSTPYNWDSLMNKHTTEDGLSCKLVLLESIVAETAYQNVVPLFNDTPARIREFCKDAYLDWGTDYILIGGDDNVIPARHMDSSAENDVDADIYWNHLDNTFNADSDSQWGESGDSGYDLYGELHIGRVPCDVPQDVSNWLTKCFYYTDSQNRNYLDNAAFYGGDTGWSAQGDDFIDYSAIMGCSNWLGPNPGASPTYPGHVGFQYGFETWNTENPGSTFDMTVKWTAEPPNPGGWMGGSSSAAINGLKSAISNDTVTLIAGIAHANADMSLDVGSSSWESGYHNTMPFFIHDYGCHCGDIDAADDGVLHSMLFHSNVELAFACVYNTGYGWGNFDNTGSSSSLQQKSFFDYLFDITNNSGNTQNWQMGKAQLYSKAILAPTVSYSDGSWRSIHQCCLLFGDPAQKIKPPAEPELFISFPNALPSGFNPPGPATQITIDIQNGLENYVAGSGKLHYRFGPLDPYSQVAVTALGGNLYEAVIPNTSPGDKPEFYFSAQGDMGTTVLSPWNAPANVYSFDVCLVTELYSDDFETDKGWTVQNIALDDGPWERGVPAGGGDREDPPTDADGSGRCYLTDNVDDNSDVDGGPTILTSPVLDLSSGDAEISYYIWHGNDDGDSADNLVVEVSNNNGGTWKTVESLGSTGAWVFRSFTVSDYWTPTSQMRVRVSAMDNPNDSVDEAGLDAFKIRRIDYDSSLWADAYAIPASTGATVNFSMNAGAGYGNKQYLLLGTASGTSPGLTLPGGVNLPINWDVVTNTLIAMLGSPAAQNFTGYLDPTGGGNATLDTLGPVDPSIVGAQVSFAYFTVVVPHFASNSITLVVEP